MELRKVEEVQRAHDCLTAIILSEVPNPFKGEPNEKVLTALMLAQLDVLCWALNHTITGNKFSTNLESIEAWLEKRGYTLQNHGN